MFPAYNVDHNQDSEECRQIIGPLSIHNYCLPQISVLLKKLSIARGNFIFMQTMTKIFLANRKQIELFYVNFNQILQSIIWSLNFSKSYWMVRARAANFQTLFWDLRLFVILQTFLLLFLYMLKTKTFLHIPSQNHQQNPKIQKFWLYFAKKFCDSR